MSDSPFLSLSEHLTSPYSNVFSAISVGDAGKLLKHLSSSLLHTSGTQLSVSRGGEEVGELENAG
jgi:hypothetical protein